MTHDEFMKNVVQPINMMGKEDLYALLRQLNQQQFTWVTQKSWDEQDKMPVPDEDKFEDAYQETLPIVLMLEKLLKARIYVDTDMTQKNKLSEQLALVSLILSPHKLEGIAESINKKRTTSNKA